MMLGNRLIIHPRNLDSSLQCSAALYVGVFGPLLPSRPLKNRIGVWCSSLCSSFHPCVVLSWGPCALSTPNL